MTKYSYLQIFLNMHCKSIQIKYVVKDDMVAFK